MDARNPAVVEAPTVLAGTARRPTQQQSSPDPGNRQGLSGVRP